MLRHGAVLLRRAARPSRRCSVRPGVRHGVELVGATLGATAAFLLARTVAGEWVARRVGGGCGDWLMVSPPRAGASSLSCAWCRSFLQPAQLCARADRRRSAGLRSDIGRLHAAGSHRLYLARLCGPVAAVGDAVALRSGLLGLGVLAMIAFLPRLFRRFRGNTLYGSNWTNCSADYSGV